MKHLQNARLQSSRSLLEPSRLIVEPIVRTALLEDLAHGNDLTTDAIVDPECTATAHVVAREAGVVAGVGVSMLAFELLGGKVDIDVRIRDGETMDAGATIAQISGSARTILTGERTMLNFFARLCGIATATRSLVDLVAGTRAHVVCTRKTTPGLRVLEKYAVRCGGGSNHRYGLDDAVLIKDNHLTLAGSVSAAVAAARERVGHLVKIEVEVDTLDQLREALQQPIDVVLLDNMPPAMLREAVAMTNGRVLTEASGGIRPETIRAVADAGVDLISVGWLTHGARALDIGLDVTL